MVLAINEARQMVRLESYCESGYLQGSGSALTFFTLTGARLEEGPSDRRHGGIAARPRSLRPRPLRHPGGPSPGFRLALALTQSNSLARPRSSSAMPKSRTRPERAMLAARTGRHLLRPETAPGAGEL